MDETFRVLVIILVMPGMTSGAEADCGEGRIYYATEKTCIHLVGELKTWIEAMDSCENDWLELVQIWNEEKNTFVKEHFPALDAGYWIGVSDTDSDGTFEYINGTKLMTELPGLGKFRKTGGSNETDIEAVVGKCGMMSAGGEGWIEEDCSAKHPFLCEEFNGYRDDGEHKGTECTLSECNCYKHDWYELPNTDMYALVHRVTANQRTSEQMCNMLGGNLIKITNKEMETSVKGLIEWDPVGSYRWVGLRYHLKSESWKWEDGTALDDDDYQNWYGYKAKDFKCVAVIWDYKALWRVTACHHEHFHVCQAHAPCSSNPTIIIRESRPLEDKNGSVQSVKNKQAVDIKCFLYGYTRDVIRVELDCEGTELRKIGTRQTAVVKLLTVDLTMHGNKCVCKSFAKDRPPDRSEIIIDVETHPYLTVEKAAMKTFDLPNKGNFTLTLSIAANPEPTNFSVTKNEMKLGESNYSVRIEPLAKKLHYLVTLDLFECRLHRIYSFVVDNGLEKKLDYKFAFVEREAAGVHFTDFFAINGLIIVAITALLIVCLVTVTLQVTRNTATCSKKGKSDIDDYGDPDDFDAGDDAYKSSREGSADTPETSRLEPIMHDGMMSEPVQKPIV